MSDATGGLLGETASRLFRDLVTPAALASAEQGEWPGRIWAAVEAAGLHQALVPEAAGGFGVPVADALALLRLAGEAALPAPLAETMLASWLLAGAGLPVPNGPLTVAADGDTLALQREGAGWRLSGRVSRVAWGRDAAAVAVLAKVDRQPFVVLLRRGAWQVEPGANLAREPRDALRMDAALAPGDVAPSASGIGEAELRAAGAVTRSLMIAGALERVRDMSVRYAQERKQFGKPIGRFQAVQQNLAVLAGQAAAADAAADLAAEAFADGLRLSGIAAGKARAGEAAGVGAAIAHQVHGAIGFTYEHGLHYLTKRLWAWRDEWGTEAEWSLLLGRLAAAAGPDRLWAELAAI